MTTVVIQPDSSELSVAEVEQIIDAEIQEEATQEVAETIADSAVEIAIIEANRDIVLAEIQAEVSSEAIAAGAERRDEQWQLNELQELRDQVQSLNNQIQAMQLQSSLEPSSSEDLATTLELETATEEAIAEEIAEDLTLQSTPDPTSSTLMEATAESAVDVLDQQIPLVELPRGPILKLV